MKKKKKADAPGAASKALLAATTADVLGRLVAHLAADGIHRLAPAGLKDAVTGGGGDPASLLLRALYARPRQDLRDLHRTSNLDLTQLLAALRDARHFGLVEADEEGEAFSLTRRGRRLAEALARAALPRQAVKLLRG